MEQMKEYQDYHIPIEEREKKLFSDMRQLDEDSLQLFKDLQEKKQVEEERIQAINQRFLETKDAFDHLYLSQLINLQFANKRLFGKAVIATTTSFYATLANRFLGIASFVVLMKLAGDYYIAERQGIEAAIKQYDYNQITLIERTLENCNHLSGNDKPKEYAKQKEE